jgi:hypothetical protein
MGNSGLVELEAVVAIAKLGSFRAAALDLHMSPTAIGNAVASLDNRLGVRLFRSIISSWMLTPTDSCSRGRGCRATGGFSVGRRHAAVFHFMSEGHAWLRIEDPSRSS